MRKWAWRICVTASLLLLAGTAGMWARAQWASDGLSYQWIGRDGEDAAVRDFCAVACRRSVVLRTRSHSIPAQDLADAQAAAADPLGDFGFHTFHENPWAYSLVRLPGTWTWRGWAHGGFGWERWSFLGEKWVWDTTAAGNRARRLAGPSGTRLSVPYWFLALTFALAPARALRAWRKGRRGPPHACTGCGYDLRATADPAGPRLTACPECGRPSAGAASASAQRARHGGTGG